MQYDYERFTPDRFQEFCQALLVKEFDSVQCFPVGQGDGGRDALGSSPTDGTIVFQVKFKRDRQKGDDPFALIKSSIDKELPKIKRLVARGAQRYVIMTNLGGSSALDVGSMDKAQKYLEHLLPVPGQVWWRPDLDARLNNAYDLKWVFSEILTSGDMLRMLIEEGLGENPKKRMLAINAYLTAQYAADEYVKFKQADLQASDLLSLFIDVPISFRLSGRRDKDRRQALGEVFRTVTQDEIASSPPVRRRAEIGGATLLCHTAAQQQLFRVVIEGAPGQGKSTLAQFICQVQRMRFLGKDDKLAALPSKYRLAPARIPFKVDLRDLSSWLQREDPITGAPLPSQTALSLESFLAAQVSHFSGGLAFTVDDLSLLLSQASALIVLDGLDEVASLAERRNVIDSVTAAAARIQTISDRTQIIVTSRPAAAVNTPTFNAATWDYLHLDAITEELIYEYTDRWSAARNITPMDVEEIKRILRSKLSSSHIKDLARNAMQLTILLNLVHIRGQALPDHRTELYDKYIDVFFNREADKNKVVLDNRQLLVDLHGYLAWRIHSAAESKRTNGRVSEELLRQMILDYLVSRDHNVEVLDDLLNGVVQRIVALVSRVEGTFEFEVQPLREYFAARHLYNTAPYSPVGHAEKGTKPEIFSAIAPNPFWLNVSRFYAGCYSVGELAGLADQVEEMLSQGEGAMTSFPRVVATSLLADRVFHQAPKVTKRVASMAVDARTLRYSLQQRLSMSGNSIELSLPTDCGMQEAAGLSMKRALALPSPSARREAALTTLWITPAGARSELWWASRPEGADAHDPAVRNWLEAGVFLGTIQDIPEVEALEFARQSDEFWKLLVEGGHPAVLASLEDQWRVARAAADGLLHLERLRGRMGVLGAALNASRFEALRHGEILHSSDMAESDDCPILDPGLAQLAGEIKALTHQRRREFVLSREPWDLAIEAYERALGRTWLSWRLGVLAVSWGAVNCITQGQISFDSSPIDFAAVARDRRSDTGWWTQQLAQASGLNRRTWVLLLLRFGTPANLREHLPVAEEIVHELSSGEYRSVVDGLVREPGTTIPWKAASGLVERAASARIRIPLAVRAGQTVKSGVTFGITDREMAKDSVLADLGLEWHVSEFPGTADDRLWRDWLEEAARLYRWSGEVFAGHGFGRFSKSFLPHGLAKVVLEQCDDYPGVSISLADRVLTTEEQKRLSSVALLAKRARWAAN